LSRTAVTLLVLVLLGGTAAAFAFTEKVKLERSPVTAPKFDREFSPVCDCDTNIARLDLRFRRQETIDATMVDAHGQSVRTLASNERVSKGAHTLVWDGRDDAGAIVPDGVYRLRIRLENERRTILVPTTIRVDTKAPVASLIRVRPEAFSPDGDDRGDQVKVLYRSNEEGRPELLVDGASALVARNRARGQASVNWNGKLGGEVADVGNYLLSIVVRDPAGNESEPTSALPVRLRYLELDSDSYAVPPGEVLTFEVSTDATPIEWSLARRKRRGLHPPILSGTAEDAGSISVEIPLSAHPGRYVLQVTAGGYKDRAPVTVSAGEA
jgi:hypothetical protein